MKKLLTLLILLTPLLFSASVQQIEQYLLLSNSDEQLNMLEKEFFLMAKIKDGKNYCYNDKIVSLKFREYLQKNITDSDMKKILKNYENFTLLQFVSATSKLSYEKNATKNYLNELEENNNSKMRIDLVKKISQLFYNQEALLLFFEKLMKPLIEDALKKRIFTQESVESLKIKYLNSAISSAEDETLFATKEFSINELKTLLVIAKTPQTKKETIAVFGAMAYALKIFFNCNE